MAIAITPEAGQVQAPAEGTTPPSKKRSTDPISEADRIGLVALANPSEATDRALLRVTLLEASPDNNRIVKP